MGGWWQEVGAESKLGQKLGQLRRLFKARERLASSVSPSPHGGLSKPHLTRHPSRAVPNREEVETPSPAEPLALGRVFE
jgi:hypothetical protein